MITEIPNIQRQVSPESRFITLLKGEFVKHAKEINRLQKSIEDIGASGGVPVDLSNYYTKTQTDNAIYTAISEASGMTDTNTTYSLVKSNSNIILNGSDGSSSYVTDIGTQDEEIPTSMIDALF